MVWAAPDFQSRRLIIAGAAQTMRLNFALGLCHLVYARPSAARGAQMIIGGKPRNQFRLTLAGERAVTLQRIYMSYTYSTVHEGDPTSRDPEFWYNIAVLDAQHHF